jgi:hypothetical protein
MPVGVRERTADRHGDLVEWWATESDGEVSAAMLGTRALIVVSPTLNAAGEPAKKLLTIPVAEGSFRTAPGAWSVSTAYGGRGPGIRRCRVDAACRAGTR